MTRGGGRFASRGSDGFGGRFALCGGALCFGGEGDTATLCDGRLGKDPDCRVASLLAKNCSRLQQLGEGDLLCERHLCTYDGLNLAPSLSSVEYFRFSLIYYVTLLLFYPSNLRLFYFRCKYRMTRGGGRFILRGGGGLGGRFTLCSGRYTSGDNGAQSHSERRKLGGDSTKLHSERRKSGGGGGRLCGERCKSGGEGEYMAEGGAMRLDPS
jgi:hypothetical protein